MNSKKEKLLNDTYNKWMQTSLYDSPLDGVNDFVNAKIMGYGSAIDEKVLSISDYRKLINRQREQAVGLEMNFEITPVFRSISNKEDSAIFVDEIKVSIILQEGKQELFLRLTTILEYINSKWIVVHLHGSVPTETLAETDTWLVNEWKRKNEELEKLVDEKTIELVVKNRELEIETALEKVRAVAMSMNKSDDLISICEVSFKEFKKLGFENIRNTLIHIQYDEQKYFMDYDFSDLTGGAITKIEYGSHPIVEDYLKQIRSAKDAFYQGVIKEDQLEEWKDFRKNSGQIDDPRLDKATALYYYFFSIGIGDIGISTFEPIDESQLKILKRFRNVFDLAYKRYVDISLAEAQAREAQIELALERVRARTMAMQKSDELPETTFLLFQQLKELGESAEQISIGIIKEEEGVVDLSATVHGDQLFQTYTFSISEPYLIKKVVFGWKEKKKSLVLEIKGHDLINYNIWRNKLLGKNIYDYTNPEDKWIVNVAFFSKGFISFSSNHSVPTETIQLLERFAGVFDGTYTRFFDLQKAEAQAREAQIELSLERVRARAMSMHHSAELAELVDTVFKELTKLHFTLKRCQIMILEKDGKTLRTWMANPEIDMTPNSYLLFLNDHPYFQSIMKAWKDKQSKWIYQLTGAEKDAMVKYVFNETEFRFLPEMVKAGMIQTKGIYFNSSYNNFGSVQVDTLEPLSDENLDIVYRFAKVFDQTYSRFLDLQKAEAQAREAKIEAALEKVRSRTMAMQRSDELAETSAVVFKQLINLGVEPNRIYIAIIKDETGSVEFWITDEDGSKVSTGFKADLAENASFNKMFEGWKKQEKSITIDMQGKELEEYFKHLSKLKVPFKGGLSQRRRIQNIAYFSKGFIGIASPDLLQEETTDLLKRFAAVFNLTYTRFNDLKQAEAQNKIIQAENDRKTKELENARQLQLSMLPKELPKLPHLDIAVYMKTATEVGGDYYDFNVDTDETLTILVGDATGHGMMSGMMVSIMKSFFISNRMNIELKHFFENSNSSIKDMHLGRLMMPLMGVQITSEKVIATNAGMPSLLYFRNKSQKAGEFVSNNMPLGAMKGTKYLLKEIKYEKGDTLLLMTDGFAELKNENNEQYGYQRVKEEFKSVAQKSSDKIVDYLKNSASKWINGVEPDDDVTFVVIKVK